MGASYVSADTNHLDMRKVFAAVIGGEVTEASDEAFFRRKPSFGDVADIEVGDRGESALILKTGGFVKVAKSIKEEDIDKYRRRD